MNPFNRAFTNSLRRRKSGGKSKRKPRKAAAGKSRSRSGTGGRAILWLIVAVVVVIAGVGLLKWARSGSGQAALLTLGSDKMYSEVQMTVEGALVAALPGFRPGPVDAAASPAEGRGQDYDWPADRFGPGAAVRCRTVPVTGDVTWWELQRTMTAAVESCGARVLWVERIFPDHPVPADQRSPNEERDLLRVDVGVAGRPTHTLVLYRGGRRPDVRWGGAARSTAWSSLAGQEGPVVALVIDDWGYSKSEAVRTLLALPVPVTMAILPGLPYSREFALEKTDLILPPDRARTDRAEAGNEDSGRRRRLALGCFVEVGLGVRSARLPVRRREILLHLPMEPQGYPDPDPGPRAVMVGMDEQAIGDRLDEALAALPTVTGVNNHMGSAATSDRPTMAALMQVLRGRDLLFIDSLTTSRSVAYAEAVKAGLPAAKNRIFLDYDSDNQVTIKANLEVLVQSARSSGFALGIGHPHRATAEVLAREIPRLVREGVRFVTVSEMLALRDRARALNQGS